MAQEPTTDRTTIASWREELLDPARRPRLAARAAAARAPHGAARGDGRGRAATASYILARYVGRPPAAVLRADRDASSVLGITLGQRTRRAIQLAVGVALGILVADLVVQLIGTGAWQLAVIVFVGMMVVVFLGGDQLVVIQAANAGVLIAVLAIPGDPTGLSRFVDVADRREHGARLQPRALPGQPGEARGRRARAGGRRGSATVIDAVADALESEDDDAATEALRRARVARGAPRGHARRDRRRAARRRGWR